MSWRLLRLPVLHTVHATSAESPPPKDAAVHDNDRAVQDSALITFLSKHGATIFLVLVLAAFIGLRLRLVPIPFDRDEGGYAYGAWRILQGGATYTDFYTMRYPAIFWAYAGIMAVFGASHVAIHAGLLIMNALNVLLMFFLGKRFFNAAAGVAAAASFAALSLGSYTESFSANSEQFVIFFATAGLLHLIRTMDRDSTAPLFLSGLLLGVSYLMKQHGVMFIVAAVAVLMLGEMRRNPRDYRSSGLRVGLLSGGAVAPFALTVLHVWITGRFGQFTYWTFTYASEYASATPPSIGWWIIQNRLPSVTESSLLIWALAGIGLLAVWEKEWRARAGACVVIALLSVAAVSVGFYFRPHYFRLLFPILALMAGFGAYRVGARLAGERYCGLMTGVVCAVAVAYTAAAEYPVLFQLSPSQVSHRISGLNPFPESIPIADYLREHTGPDESIGVLGSEPQIYFYAKRESVTNHIYMYQLMENHPQALEMQRELSEEVEEARPDYLVVVYINTSWLPHEGAPTAIYDWQSYYVGRFYERVGLVDILSRDVTRYVWGEEAADAAPQSPYYLAVYRRIEYEPPPPPSAPETPAGRENEV